MTDHFPTFGTKFHTSTNPVELVIHGTIFRKYLQNLRSTRTEKRAKTVLFGQKLSKQTVND